MSARVTRNTTLGLAVALIGLAGCETINQDFGDLAKGFMPPTPAEAARMAIDPNDPDRRREGTLLLANAPFGGTDVYLSMYRDYVEHETDPLVRAVAIRALARHGTPDDAALFAARLEDPNVQVRWEAAKGLQRLHDPASVPALLERLRNREEHADVRVAVAIALGQYAEDRVVQGLIAALDARELSVNRAAERSLGLLTGQELGMDPRAWFTWYRTQSGDAFAARQEYLYPTYQREDTWLESIAFWTSRQEEQPAAPAGLRPSSERSTYGADDDEPEAGGEDAGG